VKREVDKIGKYVNKLKTVAVYGGEPISKQIQLLKKKPQIIIGTPGRTIDHINRKLVKLNDIKFLVLDEADEMLKMGFKEDIETILESTNSERQTVLFSATMPRQIISISKKYMNTPEVVSVIQDEETNKDIAQYYYNVQEKNKVEAIGRLLEVYAPDLTLIFCNTKRKVDDVTRELIKKGYNADKIHGDLQQTSRLDVLNKFHSGVLDILVATDVAARGLDIKNVGVVINHDVPEKADYYVHRIGRTGRIGNKGRSFTLVSRREVNSLNQIVRFTKSEIKKRNVPTPEKVIQVKEEKEIEEIANIIETENMNPYYELALKLMTDNEPISVVCALLNKIDKKDTSGKVFGDINESYDRNNKSRGSREGNSRDRNSRGGKSSGGKVTRFHLNIGSGVGLDPKKLADLVGAKTKLRNKEIQDITIRHAFSFFSAEYKHETQVMKSMKDFTYNGKKTSIQIAKEKR